MKKYTINGAVVSEKYFKDKLRLCCTKGETENGDYIAAGCYGGILNAARYAEVWKLLNRNWTYSCIYAPKGINMTFKIKEAKDEICTSKA